MTTALTCAECGVIVGATDIEEAERRLQNHHALAHSAQIVVEAVDVIRLAANALADARVRYAREFSRLKLANPAMTDKAAMYAATESTNDEVTRLEAEADIARRMT